MSDIKYRVWDVDSSEMIYSDYDNPYCDFFFDFSNGTLNLMMPVEDDFAERRESIFMEYCKLDDNRGQCVYDLDVIELTHTLKSRYQKGDKFIVFYDAVHNRFGACYFEDYGAEHTGFRSHFFITAANAKKFKVIGNIIEMGISKTKNISYS